MLRFVVLSILSFSVLPGAAWGQWEHFMLTSDFWESLPRPSAIIEQDDHLVSMNYWDLAGKLIRSKKLQFDLDVSPQQLEDLRELRKDPELKQIIEFKEKKIRHPKILKRERYHWMEIRLQVLEELEPVIKTRLLRILENEQLGALRRLAMRDRYGDGYSAFSSNEVWHYCGIENLDLNDIIRKEKGEADKRISDAALASARRFVDSLPTRAQMKFAYYAGPDNFPEVRIPEKQLKELAGVNLPFPGNSGAIDALGYYPPMQAVVGVSESQIQAMKRLKQERREEVDELKVPPPPSNMDEYTRSYHAVNAKYKKLSEEVLTPAQLLIVNRLFASGEYKRDPMAAFQRPEFIAYLELSPNELQAAITTARQEKIRLQREYLSSRKTCFMAISEELKPVARERLLHVFEGVFD